MNSVSLHKVRAIRIDSVHQGKNGQWQEIVIETGDGQFTVALHGPQLPEIQMEERLWADDMKRFDEGAA